MAAIQNNIVNGGFETGLSGWTAQDVTMIHSSTKEGFSAALLKGGALNSFLVQSITAGSGDTFVLTLSITRDTTGTTPLTCASVAYYSAANAFLGYGLIENIRVPDAAVREYQTVYGITTPAPTGTVRALLTINRLAATGTAGIIVDRIVMLQITNGALTTAPMLYPFVPTANEQTDIPQQLTSTDTPVLTLHVTTKQPNQRVKIDTFIETSITVERYTVGSVIFCAYVLKRDDEPLVDIHPSQSIQFAGTGEISMKLDQVIQPSMTFIDVVPSPGTYVYTVDGSAFFLSEGSAVALTRSINAVVYPPGT